MCVLTTVSIITTESSCPVPEASSPLGLRELSINIQPDRMGNWPRFKLMVWVHFTSDCILCLSLPTRQHEWTDQETTVYEKETTVCILRERRLLRITCQHSCLLKEGTREGTVCCTCPRANWGGLGVTRQCNKARIACETPRLSAALYLSSEQTSVSSGAVQTPNKEALLCSEFAHLYRSTHICSPARISRETTWYPE